MHCSVMCVLLVIAVTVEAALTSPSRSKQLGALEFKIFDYGTCPEFKDYAWVVKIKDKIEQDAQLFIGGATVNKDLNADNTFEIRVERVYPKRNRPLITLRSKNACEALKNQGGAAWQEIAGLVGIEHPDRCPIPKDNYNLTSWYKLDAKKIPLLLLVPKGKFRIHLSVNDFKRKTDYCYRFTFERY